MFILADIEWIEDKQGQKSLTQIAAEKVNENWETVDSFSEYIVYNKELFHKWNHMAYTGLAKEGVEHTKPFGVVMDNFFRWISDDDVLIWWHTDSEQYFRHLVKNHSVKEINNKIISIRNYVCTFFEQQIDKKTNPYVLAETAGIYTMPELQHCSSNDVRVLRELLRSINCNQEELILHSNDTEKFMASKIPNFVQMIGYLPYRYDPKTNMIHKKNCPLISEMEDELEGRSDLKKAVSKKYVPCDCCKKEYRHAFREKNRKSMMKEKYPYVYSPDSKVFHKYTCKAILSAKEIRGTWVYNNLIKSGRTPCKLCNPTRVDATNWFLSRKNKKEQRNLPKEVIKALNKRKLAIEEHRRKLALPKEEAEKEYALKRQNSANIIRNEALFNKQLSEAEIQDICVKTNPYYSFWVAKGYDTFHSYGCSKLNGLKNIRGFRTYEDAIDAGFKPCKKCKPTAKKNQKYSIPVNTCVRFDEKIHSVVCRNEAKLGKAASEEIIRLIENSLIRHIKI